MGFFSKTLDKLKGALRKTATVLNTDVRTLFIPGRQIDEAALAEWEQKFLQADMGVKNVQRMIGEIRESWRMGKIKNASQAEQIVRDQILAILNRVPPEDRELKYAATGPTVILVAGINGAGKTTSIAKLALIAEKPDGQKSDGLRQRHLPRRGRRPIDDLVAAHRRGNRQTQDGLRSRGGGLRRLRGRQSTQLRHPHRRHRRPAATRRTISCVS
jgi:hypothetical protein